MASLLRRLRRDKEKPADREAPQDAAESGPPPSPSPEPAPSPADPDPPVAPPPPEDLTPSGPPPPLPQADAEGSRPERFSHSAALVCFVCGTAMQESYCPTCRMNWIE